MRTKRVCGLCVLAAFTVALLGASVVESETLYGVSSQGVEWVRDSNDPRMDPAKGIDTTFTENGITFNITYDDTTSGFMDATEGPARRARFEDALGYIALVLNETGTLDITAEVSQSDASGFLAAAGTIFGSLDTAFTNGGAFERIVTDVKPFPGFEEIFVTVDFGWPWYTGTGTTPGGQFDLLSVLTHEITHGLGILNLSDASGATTISPNVFSRWEELIERSSGADLWDLQGGFATFVGSAGDLTSQDVVFTGPEAVTAFTSAPPVYAPPSYSPGSSLGHFDLGIAGGAIMEPSFAPGTSNREYAPVEIGALIDIGWVSASDPAGPPPASLAIASQTGSSFFVVTGDSAAFSVTTSGAVGTPTFIWRKDGGLVSNGTGDGIGNVSGATTASLTINNIDISASGSYIVEVNDDAKKQVFSAPFVIEAVEGLPVSGLIGLGLLAGVCALGGAAAIRRRK